MATASDLRQAIRDLHRRDEGECVAALRAEVEAIAYDRRAAASLARALIDEARTRKREAADSPGAAGIDSLLHEYSLGSEEGVALLSLAEALARIPDATTADLLIADKLAGRDWRAHLGGHRPLVVNAASWGLVLSDRLVAGRKANDAPHDGLLARRSAPFVRKAVDFALHLVGERFVFAASIGEAIGRSRSWEARGYLFSYDMLGEGAVSAADAERHFAAYATAIAAAGNAAAKRGVRDGAGVSVKLSALHPRYVRSQRERVFNELLPRLQALMALARGHDIALSIDAEEEHRLELSLDLFAALAADPGLAGWDGMGFVVQAYQKRAPAVIDFLIDLAHRCGRQIPVRLVKGAYWDSEIKRTQVQGLADYALFTRKAHTDLAYLACAQRLLVGAPAVFPQFATHNANTIASVLHFARARGQDDFEFQRLHGMGEALYDALLALPAPPSGRRPGCRIYAPVGAHKELLPYLVRRLLENGANSSFVNRLDAPGVRADELIEDPLASAARAEDVLRRSLPRPPDLYAPRVNSSGVDLADEETIAALETRLAELASQRWSAAPRVAGVGASLRTRREVGNPARRGELVGTVAVADASDVEAALAQAAAYAERWFAVPRDSRASALYQAASLFEQNRDRLVGLCVREAGKTWGNAIDEVREAVDFCRYYAGHVCNAPFAGGEAPGPVVCISPWNFPLSIFVGQVAAALAVGSPVLAKPAEQTPLVAAFAVGLLHAAGIPPAALQLLPGEGESVGAALVADARVRGVLFTGSTDVARQINASLAARADVSLIAETGGQNALIADSSALPEQLVADVLASAFDSAGQRCSALRVLCLQEEVADTLIGRIKAAMRELVVGDPARLATDVGPVIDEAARGTLASHVDFMRATGHAVFAPDLPTGCANGSFIAPTLIEIASIGELAGEVFGPVLHVLRFHAERLDELVGSINAAGYGLTLGVHSRIDARVRSIARVARVGNLYVNRAMTGAVVGVQPFGGEGLSGTGPKAGGPLYLHRLAASAQVPPSAIGGVRARRKDAPPDTLAAFSAWAGVSGRRELANRCVRYAALTLAGTHCELPGPTGERNELSFVGRGVFLCLASDAERVLDQFAALLATGNDAAFADDAAGRAARALLPHRLAAAVALRPAGQRSGIAGVLFEGDAATARRWREALAAQPGPLLPFIVRSPQGDYPLYRLIVERVLTINTAAVGGDAALLARVA